MELQVILSVQNKQNLKEQVTHNRKNSLILAILSQMLHIQVTPFTVKHTVRSQDTHQTQNQLLI